MSPTESQLRAALHDGEGDAPDATAVISAALRIQRDRRRRLTTVGGALAAAAAVGLGSTLLLTGNGSQDKAGDAYRAAGGGAAAHAPSARVAAPASRPTSANTSASSSLPPPRPAAGVTASDAAAKLRCPPRIEQAPQPVPSGPRRPGDPLFARPVSAMKVCAYPPRSGASTRSVVIAEPAAARLAATLEAQPARRAPLPCPVNADFLGGTIEIRAVDARGEALVPVVITLGCRSSQATNGSAVRFVEQLPDGFVALLGVPPAR